ncbi:MAG TPA: TonB family protein [Longimicrobium sp.]|nr:TonB family protein [Longimicrobium sp.]
MLNVYVRGRKRRIWSPATIAVSVGAHLLLLAGVVSTAVGTPEQKDEAIEDVVYTEIDQKPKVVPPPIPVERNDPPPSPTPERQPVPGDFVTPRPPETVPTEIPTIDLSATPISPDDVTGIGREGDIVGPRTDQPTPLTGATEPSGNGEDAPLEATMVEELPELANRAQAERLFRQNYPPLLRESGMTGRTMVTMIIDAEGKVEPGSVSVQETTHEAFRAAAIKVAEKLRFRPARLGGRPVSVIIAIPIEWKLDS